jgi:Domain of unknown function (DUF4394)
LTVIAIVLAASLALSRSSASAKTGFNVSGTLAQQAPSAVAQDPSALAQTTAPQGMAMPPIRFYALSNDSSIYAWDPVAKFFTRLGRPFPISGNLTGIDFRPADASRTSVYGLTDTGKLYLINLNTLSATLVSTLTTRFDGGYQSLMDFNPVVNALRLIGSNDQNLAVVNSNGGNLNVTAAQTAMAYAAGDVNAGVDPNIACGAYTNNVAGATSTLFYGIDYALDTFVTIAPPLSATGSSNTGGGQLQTIGRIVTATGALVNVAPDADFDIYTDANGVNTLIGINGNILFTISLAQINPALPLGTTQNVVVRGATVPVLGGDGGFIDIAIPTSNSK